MNNKRQFEDPRTVLKRHGLKPKHSWGQNFLISERAVKAITDACVDEPGRLIIEIGAGLGTLTSSLLDAGGHVIAVERDRDMCQVLRAEFKDHKHFSLHEADAAKFDYASQLADGGVIVGNLPYQITGLLIRKVLETGPLLHRAVLMMQQEVADRIVAEPGDKSRGALSVIVQARCKTSIVHRLAPGAFHPPPKVRSAVVMLEPLKATVFDPKLEDTFDRVVKAAFSSRRKTLRNSLASGGLGSSEEVVKILYCRISISLTNF